MCSQRRHAGVVSSGIATRKTSPAAEFQSEFDVLISRCQPLQLQAVITELPAEEGLIGQRVVSKVPGMDMLRIQIADP